MGDNCRKEQRALDHGYIKLCVNGAMYILRIKAYSCMFLDDIGLDLLVKKRFFF